MKYFTFFYLFIFNASLLYADRLGVLVPNQLYVFTYVFNSPSLGPVDGVERARILIKNGKVVSIFDLKSGLESRNIRGLDILIDIIHGKRKENLQIEYDKNKFPKKIKSPIEGKAFSGGYSINIEDFKFIKDTNYTIGIRRARSDEFKANHHKWIKLDAKNYNYTYQDSKEKDLHMEGVEVDIRDEKIIKAIDVRSYQPIIQFENQSYLTIRKLFEIVRERLESNQQISILYDEEYGYPYWIGFKGADGNLRSIFSRNFRKEF